MLRHICAVKRRPRANPPPRPAGGKNPRCAKSSSLASLHFPLELRGVKKLGVLEHLGVWFIGEPPGLLVRTYMDGLACGNKRLGGGSLMIRHGGNGC